MITLALCIIVFLFCLFVFSKDDFVLLRRNVTPQTIFDIAFFVGLGGLFFSRLFYALTHFSLNFLNPFVFFIIPYFPGLTASGLLFGGCSVLYLFAMRKKFPLGKLFDIFTLSFLLSTVMFFAGRAGEVLYRKDFFLAAGFGIEACVLLILFILLQKLSNTFSWKDGSAALISLFVVNVAFLISSFLTIRFKALPIDISISVALFFLLFVCFLIAQFRKTQQKA